MREELARNLQHVNLEWQRQRRGDGSHCPSGDNDFGDGRSILPLT